MKILLVGKNSMIAKEFAKQYGDANDIIGIGREDDLSAIKGERNFDSVVFLAQSPDYKLPYFTEDLFDTNIALLHKTLNLLKGQTKQFIYFSTGSVYKITATGEYHETSELNLDSQRPYIASKIAGEILLNTFRTYINSIVVLRPFYMYGNIQKPHMLLPSVYKKIVTGCTINLDGTEGLIFNPVYSEDVAALLSQLISDQPKGYYIYNVAGDTTVTLKQVINIIAKKLNKKVSIEINNSLHNVMVGRVNIPGWAPLISLEEGIERTFFDDKK